jgi:hypothetical protein
MRRPVGVCVISVYDEGPRDGGGHLEVHGMALFQPLLDVGDGIVRVALKYVEVADAVFAEEWTGHRAVESLEGV